MNSKLFIFCLFGLLITAQAAGPFCGLCTKMVKDVIKKHNKNFTGVDLLTLQVINIF